MTVVIFNEHEFLSALEFETEDAAIGYRAGFSDAKELFSGDRAQCYILGLDDDDMNRNEPFEEVEKALDAIPEV